jgi:hypothetical protein
LRDVNLRRSERFSVRFVRRRLLYSGNDDKDTQLHLRRFHGMPAESRPRRDKPGIFMDMATLTGQST